MRVVVFHLEAAAVRDDGAVASDETVQAPGGGNQLWPGLQSQVVSVGKHEVDAGGGELAVRHGFERGVGAHRNVARGVDDAVWGVDAAHARGGFGGLMDELEAKEVARLVRGELAGWGWWGQWSMPAVARG